MNAKTFLLINLFLIFFERALFGIIVPFYPLLAKERNLNEILIGLVFGMYAVGGVSSSLIVIIIKKQMNLNTMKSQLAIYGFVMGLTVILFGVIKLIQNPTFFLLSSMLLRFAQGYISGAFKIIVLDMIKIIFENDKNSHKRFLGFLLTFDVMGDFLGPSIGSVIHVFFGYICLFLFLGLLFLLLSFVIKIVKIKNFPIEKKNLLENLSEEVKEVKEEKEEKNQGNQEKTTKQKCIKDYFKFPIMMNSSLMLLIFTNFYLIYPNYSLNMKKKFNLDDSMISLIFSTSRLVVCIFALISATLANKLDFKMQYNFGCIIQIIGLLFIAPSTQIGIPKAIWIVVIGLNFSALALNLCCNSFILIIIEISEKIYGRNGKELIDSSALFLLIYNLSEFFGPLLGGFLVNYMKFSIEMIIFSIITFVVYLLYVFSSKFSKIRNNLIILK